MSATLQRPTGQEPASAAPPPAGGQRDGLLMLATLALLVVACLPLARVYVGLSFLRPVLGSVLLALGLSWGSRRLGAGPVTALLVTIAGWITFCSAAFFGETLAGGILPSGATVGAAATLWARGLELMQLRPSPAFAEAGLMFITITGVWAITHAVEGLVFRLAAPVVGIMVALVLWAVPLAVAPPSPRAWAWAVPFLAASALLLLAFAGADLRRWGLWVPSPGRTSRAEPSLLPSGGVLALIAIVAGSVLAGALPGFGETPWYEVRGRGGTTLTTNPIVDIRTRLVAQDTGPIMRVITDRPVYLRTTGLDVYSESEEWTNAGISGEPVGDSFPEEVRLGPVERVRLDVEVRDLPAAVLVPAPYQTVAVSGPLASQFQYDQSNSTVTLDAGVTLTRGDTYSVVAAIPAPSAEQLAAANVPSDVPQYVQLPASVPAEVRRLASDIVQREDATSPFEAALAIQNELRSWEYSTTPPQGHSGQAMLNFITNRIGYCEQYAGTMAVMLRSLGIPARVAVGYTPGELVDSDSNAYVVSNGNAHSWVEVLFDGLGWIAFEPTPRSDGNVLVPSASNVAPSQTVSQRQGGEDEDVAAEEDFSRQGPGGEAQNRPTEAPVLPQDNTGGGAGTGGEERSGWILLLGLVGVAVVVGGVASTRAARTSDRTPLERVLRARADAERLGRGVGMPPATWETDREYLGRLAHRHGEPARSAADDLATQAARARYARELAPQSAQIAEEAAGRLTTAVLAHQPGWRRAAIGLRGRASAASAQARARIRR